MLEKIQEYLAHARANAATHLHAAEVIAALHGEVEALKERVEGLGHEATGETGAVVMDMQSGLASLTSAVSSIGARLDSIGSLVGTDGAVKSLGERLAALETKSDVVVGVGNQYAALTDLLKQVMARQDEIDAKLKALSAPAAPPVPTQQ